MTLVSHPHRDLEKVRRIRNELERRGHNPLLFFLKYLEDDDARLPEGIEEIGKDVEARSFSGECEFARCNRLIRIGHAD